MEAVLQQFCCSRNGVHASRIILYYSNVYMHVFSIAYLNKIVAHLMYYKFIPSNSECVCITKLPSLSFTAVGKMPKERRQ